MPQSKVRDLSAAVDLIDSGSSVALGLALEHAIPFAAGHELIRQGTDDLTLVGPISDLLFDQLIGAELVETVRAAWVGNVSTGTGYNFRRAVEEGNLDVENHSNFSVALSLKAGAMGVPYLPTRSLLGSDVFAESERFREAEDPYSGDRLALVPAIRPDWSIVHVQRASPYGDAHFWGNSGVTFEGVDAATETLVVAEEIVDPAVIKSDPSRTTITGDSVTAVAEVPYGCHPSPLAGRYNRDNEHYVDYAERTTDRAGTAEWLDEWVHSVPNREAYMERVEKDLRPTERTVAAEVEYGR
ncbi:CoA transferase subunit A [Halomicroarcula limicola]|uniref:CoA transferase subunit A n=1 Tax=Haloarcula limicola TaxID=1429915 RepID=A0A8J7YGB2_9EURY|nr:CoA transferase subunit A [Halomicroarcula limicola]MBV0925958.1 CoA transferase subunit A [Halomicroarcula limicola]